jgi:hypothetical protein
MFRALSTIPPTSHSSDNSLCTLLEPSPLRCKLLEAPSPRNQSNQSRVKEISATAIQCAHIAAAPSTSVLVGVNSRRPQALAATMHTLTTQRKLSRPEITPQARARERDVQPVALDSAGPRFVCNPRWVTGSLRPRTLQWWPRAACEVSQCRTLTATGDATRAISG